MCIALKDYGEIVVQLEFVDENNTVVIKNDSDYTHFQQQFVSTFNKVHARDLKSPGSSRAK
eukprot:7633392-Karenia_brevis.AAC.1